MEEEDRRYFARTARGPETRPTRRPSPASACARPAQWQKKQFEREHHIDKVLIQYNVLASPLASSWILHVPTSWDGADPTPWRRADYTVLGRRTPGQHHLAAEQTAHDEVDD